MPIYEYRCKNCGYIIEVRHPLNDPPDTIFCDMCKKDLFFDEETVKLISKNSFKLNWEHFHNSTNK
jgi:putative FmdB family regulatory protein